MSADKLWTVEDAMQWLATYAVGNGALSVLARANNAEERHQWLMAVFCMRQTMQRTMQISGHGPARACLDKEDAADPAGLTAMAVDPDDVENNRPSRG